MKKWQIACLLALLVLLTACVAMACPNCSYPRENGYHYAWEGKTETTHNVMCPSCGYRWTENHLFSNTVVRAATCTEEGAEYDQCYCGYTLATRTIPKLAHDLVSHDGKAPTCTEDGWEAYQTCKNCDYTTYQALPAAGHSYLNAVTEPTCTKGGYTTHTCTVCGDSFNNRKTAALGHWYGDWTPETDGTHTADCRRSGCRYQNAVACAAVACKLTADDETVQELTLCPVCGEISGGASLARVEKAAAHAVNKSSVLPAGELTLRIGALESGETLLSVCFERGGSMTQPAGKIKITLPAELLEGYTLSLLHADGSQSPLTVGTDSASFTLDFTGAEMPVMLIRLAPAA